ncbi:hypothetical protein AKJ63_01450 [candidate division MSBL1 archaeon SCGC-AAA259D18]|uniref:Uncharacterized protein n=1 Tax=candidate division MSBL1 archaeon SCGC-AAA259D18 TaxID=1698262 RepID=A0A133UB77_9EURY|nr:hypothetical protein AKJ63_01450 [candidate division MSBL1 archaeon SCGC-AAA259D18]
MILLVSFAILIIGVYHGIIPLFSFLIFLTLPLAGWSIMTAYKNYHRPKEFTSAIKETAFIHFFIACLLIASYLV